MLSQCDIIRDKSIYEFINTDFEKFTEIVNGSIVFDI